MAKKKDEKEEITEEERTKGKKEEKEGGEKTKEAKGKKTKTRKIQYVLDRGVKTGGKVILKGTVIEDDHPDYNVLEPFLVEQAAAED